MWEYNPPTSQNLEFYQQPRPQSCGLQNVGSDTETRLSETVMDVERRR